MSGPHIVHVCTSKSWGGLEMSSLRLAQLCEKNHYETSTLCWVKSPLHLSLNRLGHQCKPVSPQRKYFSRTTTNIIRRHLESIPGPVVIMVHYLSDLWFVAPAIKGLGDRVNVFGFAQMFLTDVRKKGFFHRRVYRPVRKMVALGERQKDFLVQCLPLPKDQYVIIPNHVDTQIFAPGPRNDGLRLKWGIKPTDFLVGFCGRIDQGKGPAELIQAFAALKRAYPHLKLAMVGRPEHSEFELALKESANQMGISDDIVWTGHIDDLAPVYRAFDLFIMPSYEEAFGFVLVEAMASGIPAIATAAGGVPEIIQHLETGYLIEPRSSASIENAIKHLMTDNDLSRRLAESGRTRAVQVYDSKIYFAKVQNLIHDRTVGPS